MSWSARVFWPNVTIREESADGLSAIDWTFWLRDSRMYFDAYEPMSRPSTRHKYRVAEEKAWDRLRYRYRHGGPRPPVPDDVANEAVRALREAIGYQESA